MTYTAFSINKVKQGDQKFNKSVTFLLKNSVPSKGLDPRPQIRLNDRNWIIC